MSVALGALIAQIEIRDRAGGEQTCVQRNGFCPDWIVHNLGEYVSPFLRHLELTVLAVTFGFVIAFGLALAAHRRRWLVAPITGITGVLYTLPSLALFFLLQPITGRGVGTALIALTGYTLLILFRNITLGLDNVPADVRDAARGQGLTDAQVLWRVELPLALPEIVAGLRIAVTTTVSLATLVFLAGAGGWASGSSTAARESTSSPTSWWRAGCAWPSRSASTRSCWSCSG